MRRKSRLLPSHGVPRSTADAGAAASASPRMWTASSASAAVTMRGGARRSTSSPMALTSRPRSRAAAMTSPALTPLRQHAEQEAAAAHPGHPAAGLEPLQPGPEVGRRPGAERASRPPAPSSRSTARATAQPRGLPPKVLPWLPAERWAPTSSLASSAPMGKPAPSALADERRSGRDALPLVRPHLAGAPQAGLHLVEAEERAGPGGELAGRLQVAGGRLDHAGLALDGLDHEGGGPCRRGPAPAPPGRRRGRAGRRAPAARSRAGTSPGRPP